MSPSIVIGKRGNSLGSSKLIELVVSGSMTPGSFGVFSSEKAVGTLGTSKRVRKARIRYSQVSTSASSLDTRTNSATAANAFSFPSGWSALTARMTNLGL